MVLFLYLNFMNEYWITSFLVVIESQDLDSIFALMSRQSVSLSGNLRSKRLLPKRTARECEGYGAEELGLGKKYTIGFSVAFYAG